MTAFEKDIVALVRGALTGDTPTLSAEADYARIFEFGKRQQIIYLLYAGLCLVDGFEESVAGMNFLQAACSAMAAGVRQQQEIEQLRTAFSARGIDFMPLKGTLLRPLYPTPEMRQMGDADFLIREAQEEAAAEVMRALGYTGEAHEVVWQKPGALTVELPHDLIAEKHADLHAYYAAYDIWAHAKPVAGCEYRMTPEDEYIFDFLHFVKHFRTSGAGLRHVIDLYLLKARGPALDEAVLRDCFTALGCMDFYRNICALADCWFGQGTETAVIGRIVSLLFAGGIYGDAKTAERTRHAHYREQYRFAGAANWLHMACPPLAQQKKRYPILKKAPFLLPFTWILHGFVVLFRRPATIGSVTDAAMEIDRDTDNDRFAELAAVGLRVNKDTFSKR